MQSLQPLGVQQLVATAGGTVRVADALHVDVERVVLWSREGLTEAPVAAALFTLARQERRPRVRRPRVMLVTAAELEDFIAWCGSGLKAARELGVTKRSIRRYRNGHVVLPARLAIKVLARLQSPMPAVPSSPVGGAHASPTTAVHRTQVGGATKSANPLQSPQRTAAHQCRGTR